MRQHQYLGLLLLLAGAGIALYPKFCGNTPVSTPATVPPVEHGQQINAPTQVSLTPISPQPVPPRATKSLSLSTPTPTIHASGTHLDYLAERALREAEAAAQRAAMSFMKEIMAPVEANDRSFAEELYSIGANAKAISKSEPEYRDYVAKRFYEELTRSTDIQKNLDAIAFEYLDRLDRIAKQIAIESGLDVTNLPTVTLTITDFDKLLRADIRESVGQTSSTMQQQARQGAVIQTVSFGIGLLMPTKFVIDLAIGMGIDTAADSFRDPVGQVAIDSHRAAEQLAERICFGADQHQGLYAALLDIAHYQNSQLREILRHGEALSEPESMDAVFGGAHE